MSTIHFAPELPHLEKTHSGQAGVYSTRRLSRTPSGASKGLVKEVDLEDEENTLRQEGDVRKKQVFKGWVLLWLAYQSTGVIYGDIGTSPLYVYSSTFSSNPSYDDLLGALSLIIWTITLIVSVKYVFIVLFADDEGEGGTFALYSLLSRYSHIAKRDPKEESMVKMERYLSSDMKTPGRTFRTGMENSAIAKAMLKIVGVLGVSMIMSDGVLTPAQSVLGAIQGLEVVNPNITTSTIIGVSCAILILLFLVQPLGTAKLASAFAPIVILWLCFNGAFGIYNLVKFDHSVLKAFSPYFAVEFLVRNKTDGWKSLGGILLSFTGVEAMFADLGAFSRRAVQLSWMCFAFPCLLLAYIGQAAYISVTPEAYSNPFFNTVPPGMFYPSLVLAILAAIVASQAMITASFQLLSQVMQFSFFPRIKICHTSTIHHGQIYIPFANWLLMIGTVIVTAVYNNTTSLGNAYGVCVIFVTFMTTCMVAIAALIVWRLNPVLVAFGFLTFGALDGVYLSSALVKVPQGAWFTLLLACILSSIFILWRFGKEQQWVAEASDRFHPSHLVAENSEGKLELTKSFGGGEITPMQGFGIFFDKAGEMTPTVFTQFLSKFVATPDVMVFFHLRPLSVPSVAPEDRYTVTRTSIPNCYRLVIRHGYTDVVITSDLGTLVYEQLRKFAINEGARPPKERSKESEKSSELPHASSSDQPNLSPADIVAARLAVLERAYGKQVLYIVGKGQMRISASTNLWHRVMLNAYLWLRDNTRTKMADWKIPTDQLVEVGFIKDI